MRVSPVHFHRRIAAALEDKNLHRTLAAVRDKFTTHRAAAVADYNRSGGDFEALRQRGKQIRDESIRAMPQLLQDFERHAQAAGATVLWAKDAATGCRLITEIARRHRVKTAIKSKSMASEEIGLNDALQAAGVAVTETDLGEFIIQLNEEAPSHIIAPAMHKRRAEVAAILQRAIPCNGDDIVSLTGAARTHLRKKFIAADMGVSGANFLIADTGSSLIVTNEGNGRMTATLPRVHVTLAGIDKIVPRWADITDLLTLLVRSATGQRLSNYVSITTGSRRADECDGPEHVYVVLLDNGRSRLRASDCRDMLRCIRCGACMNHCPVYHTIGGHAYGSVYMGPMGQVLTPALQGLESAPDLPLATTMCGACAVVCPVKIPLPDLMRRLRRQQIRQQLRPLPERLLMRLWLFAAQRPVIYAAAAAAAGRLLHLIGGRQGWICRLPGAAGWFAGRDLIAPPGKTFRALAGKLKP